MPLKTDWLGLEREVRQVIADKAKIPEVKVLLIDEIIARYTQRGNELNVTEEQYQLYMQLYPEYFKNY